jgi:hypothetical protein
MSFYTLVGRRAEVGVVQANLPLIARRRRYFMHDWMWPVSLAGILSTAVVFGTDTFFLTIGRPALRLASPSAGTEVMGFFHLFADARMPIWGVLAILSNLLLVVFSGKSRNTTRQRPRATGVVGEGVIGLVVSLLAQCLVLLVGW